MELPYTTLPDYPPALTPGAVLARMVDGLAFRFRWATEGITPEQFEFRAGEGVSSLREVLGHMLFLADRVNRCLGGAIPPGAAVAEKFDGGSADAPPPADPQELRRLVLGHFAAARERAASLGADELAKCQIEIVPGKFFPLWNMINGPLADALTHVGQINTWRRMADNPTPKANLFLGRPPKP